MITTTTPTIEGRPVQEYLGIVSGIASANAGVFARISGMNDRLHGLRKESMEELVQQAEAIKADALVGVSIEVTFFDTTKVTVNATGTAVKLG